MEFEDEHDDEEQEEEEDDDDSITIPPPAIPPSYVPGPNSAPCRVNLVTRTPSSEPRRSSAVRYRDCLKNHAVNIGGHAVDGCGEFMPAGEDGTLDALKCAACNCHRNFHRKEPDPTTAPTPLNTGAGTFSGCYGTPAPSRYLHTSRPAAAHPSSHTSGGTPSGGEMGDDMSQPSSSGGCPNSSGRMLVVAGRPRKRHRTKFTQEQKDKMLGFAEKLGWRIQKHDEGAVQQFCAETQVKRQVLKVWMHNNKHTLGPAAQKP